MASRGRGRGRGFGRGFGGGGFSYAKELPFELFPEITLPDRKSISTDPQLVASFFNFEKFWRNSPYHIGDGVSKQDNESVDIERFSDWSKPKRNTKRGSFYDYLVLRPDNFPKELLGGSRRERPVKKARWSQEADLQDVFEKLKEKFKATGEGGEEDGDGEGEEEEEEAEEDAGEEDSDGDYAQLPDFDDDDDDYNKSEEGDDETGYY